MAAIEPPKPGYERSDARPGPVVITGIFLTVLTILGLIVAQVSLVSFGEDREASLGELASPLVRRERPEGPLLQTEALKDLRLYMRTSQERLGSYGWLDREQNRIHIPIGRAIELLNQREGLRFQWRIAPKEPVGSGAPGERAR